MGDKLDTTNAQLKRMELRVKQLERALDRKGKKDDKSRQNATDRARNNQNRGARDAMRNARRRPVRA